MPRFLKANRHAWRYLRGWRDVLGSRIGFGRRVWLFLARNSMHHCFTECPMCVMILKISAEEIVAIRNCLLRLAELRERSDNGGAFFSIHVRDPWKVCELLLSYFRF